MILHRIDYQGGEIWVDKTAECPVGSMAIFPNTRNGEIKDFEGCEVIVCKSNYAANGVHNLLVVAQSPNLSLPNIPYVEIEENVELMAELSALEETEYCTMGNHSMDCACTAHEEGFIKGYKAASAKKVIQSIDVDIADGKIVVKSIYYKETR